MSIKEQLILKNPKQVVQKITAFIKKETSNLNREGAIMGLSGGIDSALSAFLVVKALGRDKVFFIFMPERDSSKQSKKDAELVAKTLGVGLKKVELTSILRHIGIYRLEHSTFGIPRAIQERYVLSKYKSLQDENETTFLKNLKGGKGNNELKKGIAYYRIKHRLRMILWYYYGELNNYLVVGNCNKTEKITGYFVKYGDSGSDIDIIASLYKTQVKELARFVGVTEKIVEKTPSPDIIPGMTDEYALQMKYETLDQILYGIEKGINDQQIEKEAGVTQKNIQYVKELVKWSAHMRNLPPSPDISALI